LQDSNYSKDLISSLLKFFLFLSLFSTPTIGDDLKRIEQEITALHFVAPTLATLEEAERSSLARLYFQQGDLLARDKSFLKAASSFRKARSVEPSLPGVDMAIGLAYAEAGRLKLARRFLLHFLKSNEDPALKFQCEQKLYQVLVQLGEGHAGISLWDKAVGSYHEAMEYSTSTRHTLDLIDKIQTAYFKQGTFHYSQKHYMEAARNFLKALSKNTRESLRSKVERIAGHLFLNAGRHYEKLGRINEAKPYYQAVAEYFHGQKVVTYAKKRLESLENQILEERHDIPEWLRVE
jgi:tetratricopeptide (TPR) repeat protein